MKEQAVLQFLLLLRHQRFLSGNRCNKQLWMLLLLSSSSPTACWILRKALDIQPLPNQTVHHWQPVSHVMFVKIFHLSFLSLEFKHHNPYMSYYIQNAKKNWPTILRIRMNVSSHHRWQWNFLIACTSPGNWLYYFFSYNLYDWAWRDAPACNWGQIAISFRVADWMSTHTHTDCVCEVWTSNYSHRSSYISQLHSCQISAL
jgi:hypothetical protein